MSKNGDQGNDSNRFGIEKGTVKNNRFVQEDRAKQASQAASDETQPAPEPEPVVEAKPEPEPVVEQKPVVEPEFVAGSEVKEETIEVHAPPVVEPVVVEQKQPEVTEETIETQTEPEQVNANNTEQEAQTGSEQPEVFPPNYPPPPRPSNAFQTTSTETQTEPAPEPEPEPVVEQKPEPTLDPEQEPGAKTTSTETQTEEDLAITLGSNLFGTKTPNQEPPAQTPATASTRKIVEMGPIEKLLDRKSDSALDKSFSKEGLCDTNAFYNALLDKSVELNIPTPFPTKDPATNAYINPKDAENSVNVTKADDGTYSFQVKGDAIINLPLKDESGKVIPGKTMLLGFQDGKPVEMSPMDGVKFDEKTQKAYLEVDGARVNIPLNKENFEKLQSQVKDRKAELAQNINLEQEQTKSIPDQDIAKREGQDVSASSPVVEPDAAKTERAPAGPEQPAAQETEKPAAAAVETDSAAEVKTGPASVNEPAAAAEAMQSQQADASNNSRAAANTGEKEPKTPTDIGIDDYEAILYDPKREEDAKIVAQLLIDKLAQDKKEHRAPAAQETAMSEVEPVQNGPDVAAEVANNGAAVAENNSPVAETKQPAPAAAEETTKQSDPVAEVAVVAEQVQPAPAAEVAATTTASQPGPAAAEVQNDPAPTAEVAEETTKQSDPVAEVAVVAEQVQPAPAAEVAEVTPPPSTPKPEPAKLVENTQEQSEQGAGGNGQNNIDKKPQGLRANLESNTTKNPPPPPISPSTSRKSIGKDTGGNGLG